MEIIAHRGACFAAPENSIAAFEVAIAEGADRLELDVQITRDGVAVVSHDSSTERMGNRRIEIEFSTLSELRAVSLSNGETFPTLDEVCALAAGRCTLDVEIKATSGGVPGAVLSVLQRHAIEEQTLVTSFDAPVLRSLRGLGWTGRSGLLIGSRSLNLRQRAYEAWPIGALEVSQATDLVIHHQLLHRPLRQALAHRRIGLLLWTSLEDESKPEATRRLLYEKLQRTEVDGIIVARVAECRSVLAEAERFRHGHHA